MIILTDAKITPIQLPFLHHALQLEFQQFSKNTGTCAFKLNLLTLWPRLPRAAAMLGPHCLQLAELLSFWVNIQLQEAGVAFITVK